MSLDKIHSELIDYVSVIYMNSHDTTKPINYFTLSINGTARPFINSFMKIYKYTDADYTNIMIEITRFAKANSYSVCDSDYFKAINDGLIPDGKEILNQTVDISS